jgi:hypothetical protein
MALYLLFSPLVTAFLIAAFFETTHVRSLVLPGIRGVVSGVVLVPLTVLLSSSLPVVYSGWSLWSRISLVEFLIPALLGTLAFAVWDFRKGHTDDRGSVVAASAFLGGFFFVDILARVIGTRGILDGYELFLLPMARSILIGYIPLLIASWAREGKPLRFAYLVLLVLLPWILSIAGTLHELKFHPVAYLVGLFLFVAGLTGYWFFRMIYLPGPGM